MRVYTVGHAERTSDEFLDLLCRHGVTHVVDVRNCAEAEATGQFHPENVRVELLIRGMIYANMCESLGAAKVTAETDLKHLHEDEAFRSGLQSLMQVVMSDPDRVICLLGSTKQPELCHRARIIGEALARVRVDVEHIEDDEAIPHHLVMRRLSEQSAL